MTEPNAIEELKDEYARLANFLVEEQLEKFNQIRTQKEQIDERAFKNTIVRFAAASSLIGKYKPEIDAYNKEETPDFNIFLILGLHKKEVITHTPFLANLLGEFDSHQHKRLFLDSFLKKVIGLSSLEVENQNWEVIKEKENIDLKIVNKSAQKAIFIENKIATGAHSGQLSRYFKNWKGNYNGGAFIYLTVNGDSPSIEGFDDRIYSRILVEKELTIFSYKEHIYKWLEECLSGIKSNKLQYTVKQYLELIKIL